MDLGGPDNHSPGMGLGLLTAFAALGFRVSGADLIGEC